MLNSTYSHLYDRVTEMGQDNSKSGAGGDESHERASSATTQVNTDTSHVETNDTSSSVSDRSRDAKEREVNVNTRKDDAQTQRQHYNGPDRHGDDRYRRPASPSPEHNFRRSDSSPRRVRHSTSPLNTRHSFIPDHDERRSPQYNRRSSHRDHWSPARHSSPNRVSSPTNRRSQGRRQASSPTAQAHPHSASPPSVRSRTESDARDGHGFSNLSWKAAGMQSKPSFAKSLTKAQRATNGNRFNAPKEPHTYTLADLDANRVDFNGLKGVPTGPKKAVQPMPKSKPVADDVGSIIKRQPHIYISSKYLEPKEKTISHLYKFLRPHVLAERDIAVDETGYYVSFDDSDDGRDRLSLCYENKNQGILFSQYELYMVCYLNGRRVFDPDVDFDLPETHNGASTTHVPSASSPQAVADAQAFLEGLGFPRPQDEANGDIRLRSRDAAPHFHADSVSPVASAAAPMRHSSPLRVHSRQDQDDTSSISGFTDLSASKLTKCHICKAAPVPDIDPLVHCSSCPRRYHSRCHTRPSIPPNLINDHSWQCRRCIKKQVQPKSRLSNGSLAASSPAPSVGQPDEPPRKKLRLQDTEPEVARISFVDGMNDVAPRLDEEPTSTADAYSPTIRDPSGLHPITDGDFLPEDRLTINDDLRVDEAEDLVAKSFAPPETEPRLNSKFTESRRLNLLRKKLARNDVNNRSSGSQATNEPADEAVKNLSYAKDIPSNPTSVNGTPESKKKPHKWAGSGADKDIIQAGMVKMFPTDQPPSNENVSGVVRSHVEHGKEAGAIAPEVPESPEDVRDFLNERNKVDGMHTSPNAVSASHMDGMVALDPQPNDGDFQKSTSTQPKGLVQRMKPGNPVKGKCAQCKKTIAVNPSGNNKFCSQCRKELSGEATGVVDKSRVGMLERQSPAPVASAEADDESRTRDDATQAEYEKELSEPPRGEDGDSRPFKPIEGHPTKATKPRTSCEDCRANRRRCTHRSPVFTKMVGLASHLNMDSPGVPDEGLGNDQANADLDFWSAAPAIEADIGLNAVVTPIERSTRNDDDNEEVLQPAPASPSPSLSTPPSDDHDATPIASQNAKRKRRSHTVPAKNDKDLGNGFKRPVKTYEKLIAMALIDSPNHRLKGPAIVEWVAKNIPGYDRGKGANWESGLSATTTLLKEGYATHGKELWRKLPPEPGAKRHQGEWYELLSGIADKMQHWDPVLKEPVSPMKGLRRKTDMNSATRTVSRKASHEMEPVDGQQLDTNVADADSSAHAVPGLRHEQHASKKMKRVHTPERPSLAISNSLNNPEANLAAELDTMADGEGRPAFQAGDESSDDEPLARSKLNRQRAPQTDHDESNIQSSNLEVDDMDIDDRPTTTKATYSLSTKKWTTWTENGEFEPTTSFRPAVAPTVCSEPANTGGTARMTLAQSIKNDSENPDASAKSLFAEWPEFDPKHSFDRAAKIAEIKKRKTRKHRFKSWAPDPWVSWKPARVVDREDSGARSFSVDRSSRTPRKPTLDKLYPWEAGEENVKRCDTLEELFDLPNNPIAILHEGQIAYRDGTCNEDGTLPRARGNIFKIGYA